MKLEEILDQLNALTAQVKDAMAGDTFEDEEEGTSERVVEDEDTYILKAGKGYRSDVSTLCSMQETGNGYIAHFPSYSSCTQDNYICMGYDEAEYIYKLMSFIKKGKA
jgi:hypothetical protein